MTRAEIAERLRTLIEPYVPDQETLASVDEDTNLLDDLDINSANLVDIIIDIELAFDIEIDDETAEQMVTVGQAIAVIEQRLTAKPPSA